MVLLKVTYRLRAHLMAQFEEIFGEEILPLVREHQLNFKGIWRTLVGEVGEYMELWEFDSVADFEVQWKKLTSDPRLQQVFERTGPTVEGERFTLLEPALKSVSEPDAD